MSGERGGYLAIVKITNDLDHSINVLKTLCDDHIGIHVIAEMPIIDRQPDQIDPERRKVGRIIVGIDWAISIISLHGRYATPTVRVEPVPEEVVSLPSEHFEHLLSVDLFMSRISIEGILSYRQLSIRVWSI